MFYSSCLEVHFAVLGNYDHTVAFFSLQREEEVKQKGMRNLNNFTGDQVFVLTK